MLTMSIFPFNLLIYLVLLNAKKLPRVTLTPTPSPHHVVLFVIERKREKKGTGALHEGLLQQLF